MRYRRALIVCAVPAMALGACTGQADAGPESRTDQSEEPIELASCGYHSEITGPPERILAIKSSSAELLLALGAGDRMVGTAFLDAPLPEEYAAEAADVPEISEQNPSSELVLELEPDLIVAGWESNLTDAGAGDRQMYEDLGVATWVPPSACEQAGEDHRPAPLTFEDVFAEIELMGRVLGPEAQARAEELIAEQREQLAELDEQISETAGLRAVWWSSNNQTPYVGAGEGAPQLLLDAAGLENVFDDLPQRWENISWEDFAAADPDVIVLVDSEWNSAESKMEALAEEPMTSELTAVQEERYIVLPFPATEPGIRNVPGALDLHAQLAEFSDLIEQEASAP